MNYILMALTAMVLVGLSDFLLKKALMAGLNINVLTFYGYLTVGILFGISCLLKKVSLKMDKSLLKYSLITGLLIFFGTFLILTALKTGNASVIIPIARMGFVVTSICAFIFLRESITFKKGLGILAAVISLILLSQ